MVKVDIAKEVKRFQGLLERQVVDRHKSDGTVLFELKKIERLRKHLIAIEDASCAALNLIADTPSKKKPHKVKKKAKKVGKKKKRKCSKTGEGRTPEERRAYQREYYQRKHSCKPKDKKKPRKNPKKKLSSSERMKAYWKKRKAEEAGEKPEEDDTDEGTDEGTDEDEQKTIADTIVDNAAREKIKENMAKLDKLQEKVQGELKNAISFNAQKILAAMKKGAQKRIDIQINSEVSFGSMTPALNELLEKKLIKKADYGIYKLIEFENGTYSKERD